MKIRHTLARCRYLVALGGLGILLGAAASGHTERAPARTPAVAATAKPNISLEKLPLLFQPNRGQTSAQVQFVSRAADFTLFLTGPDAVFKAGGASPAKPAMPARAEFSSVRMHLLGANPAARAVGDDLQAGKVNYFTGRNRADWHTDVPVFGRVRLAGVYPGVDLVYHGDNGHVEYDFVVAPGADTARLKMHFDGAQPELDAKTGELAVPLAGLAKNAIRLRKPVAYQTVNGKRRLVASAFVMAKNGDLSFALGSYDHSRELVIDPTLVYTGSFGTGSQTDMPSGMAVDPAGELIITGTTGDLDFPATTGAYQTQCGPVSSDDTKNGVTRCAAAGQSAGMSSAYVMKLSSDGTKLVYATYLHGVTGWESGAAVQADSAGNAVVIGQTSSPDFPLVGAPALSQMSLCQPRYPTDLSGNVTGPAAQTCAGYFNGGGTEWTIRGPSGFVTKLSADGSKLLYSAFFGFTGATYPVALALDATGNIYMLNYVNTADPFKSTGGEIYYYTTASAAQPYGVGDLESGLTVLSADGQTVLYSTIFGETTVVANGCGHCLSGTQPEGLAVGQNGTVYITGITTGATLPGTTGTVQASCVPVKPSECLNNVGFVAAFDITQSGANSLKWATYLTGPGNTDNAVATQANAIVADSSNNAYVTGYTTDATFPTTAGAFATTCAPDTRPGPNFCDNTIFVSKLNPAGTAFVWSTFLNPTQNTPSNADANAIALDAHGNVYVYGDTYGTTVPIVDPLAQYPNYWYQGYPFLTVLNPAGDNIMFSAQVAPSGINGAGNTGSGLSSMLNGMALDSTGNVYLVGQNLVTSYAIGSTTLTAFPATPGTYSTALTGGGPRAFFVKMTPVLAPDAVSFSLTPSTIAAGASLALKAVVTGTTQTTPTPTGTITFTAATNGTTSTLGTATLDSTGTGSASVTAPAAGAYNVVANYSGDSVYNNAASSAVPLTVSQATTTTTLASSNANAGAGASVTFTATISATGSSGSPTGSVTFSDGSTTLGTGTVANGSASYTTSALAVGSHSITAAYSGDASFAPSTSTALTQTIVAASVGLTAAPATLTVASGFSGTVTISATPTGAYTGTLTLSCGTLPANASCAFAPATLSFSQSTAAQTSTLTFGTKAGTGAALAGTISGSKIGPLGWAGAGLAFPLFLGFAGFRKKNRALLRTALVVLLLGSSVAVMSACGGGGGGGSGGSGGGGTTPPPTSTTTPPGSYTVQVIATASGSTTPVATVSVAVTVQ